MHLLYLQSWATRTTYVFCFWQKLPSLLASVGILRNYYCHTRHLTWSEHNIPGVQNCFSVYPANLVEENEAALHPSSSTDPAHKAGSLPSGSQLPQPRYDSSHFATLQLTIEALRGFLKWWVRRKWLWNILVLPMNDPTLVSIISGNPVLFIWFWSDFGSNWCCRDFRGP